MTRTAVVPLPLPQSLGSDVSHEVCCTDENATQDRIAMCGTPIPDNEELDTDDPTCVVCLDLIKQWARNMDTYGENPQNPGDTPCRVCPRRAELDGRRQR